MAKSAPRKAKAADKETKAAQAAVPSANAMDLLAAMGLDFATTMDIESTLAGALRRIAGYVGAEAGALFMLGSGGTMLRCHACVGPTNIVGLSIGAGQGIVGRVVQTNKGEIVRDVEDDPQFDGQVDAKTGFTTRSILCAPLSVKDERLGAIELINKRGGDNLFEQADLTLLEALASSAALAVLNARMAAELVEQERVRHELELAAEIQRSLLPPPEGPDFPAHGVNLPARTVSGDFYDFFRLDDGRVCFTLGDVSGKGMNAALLMAKAASLFRCLGRTVHEPGRLLGRINFEIAETATRGMFITMVAGIYCPATGRVRFSNAGHEPLQLHRPDGSFEEFPADTPPVGIVPGAPGEAFPEVEAALDGGALYVFTDGVTEGYTAEGVELGIDGLKDILIRDATAVAADRLASVARVLAAGGGERGLRDDVTIMAIDDASAADGRSAHPSGRVAAPAIAAVPVMTLRLPAVADRLRLIRAAIGETVRSLGGAEETAHDMVLAVDEACQNIIRHAYKGDSKGEIVIEISQEGAKLIILLKDFAPTIDPSTVRPRNLGDVRPGGLGTHLIREVVDEMVFLKPPPEGGNILRLVKRIG
ncbi:MAG: GAF domain-containing protein [Alphaproteobacteria bacterium]|nr:GAF domain-containing protein [Alphaproteobacteria bacterium]